ncbi:MAG TPA: hypothetical protein PLE75_05925 [Ferruginibacter sp.]|nr:hypothetical protein [Ferruginibacter sp.]HRO06199.1 hypothetical protein [Ferruginibacter sp.]HRO96592.1 hypothetical protein [Ferruginibacter sp.]HRP49758.1 hypothetical protein [Ferruginibacter sp.]
MHRKQTTFTLFGFKFPAFTTRVFLSVFILAGVIAMTGCKKIIEDIQRNWAEDYFEDNIMERNFRITYAHNGTDDITSLYNGYTFVLYKNTFYDGPLTATKDGVTYNGTWACNEDYGKLTIQLTHPDPAGSGINFLTRSWRFTRKAIPVLEFAPWGSSQPHKLHMVRF